MEVGKEKMIWVFWKERRAWQYIKQVWNFLAYSYGEGTEVVTPESSPKSITHELFILGKVNSIGEWDKHSISKDSACRLLLFM